MSPGEPTLARSVTLRLIGDWGQANFHRICSWITQEFCDRAGPRSRVGIFNIRGGGIEAVQEVADGESHLCVATPVMMMADALTGKGIFGGRPLPDLRALAVLPQDDRLVLAIDRQFGISTYAELRERKPPLRIAASHDDGTNFIGYASRRLMEAHGIDEATLESWGGRYVTATRPEQTVALMETGEADAILQEAIMTPWWRNIMESADRPLTAIPAEESALAALERDHGYPRNDLPARFWSSLPDAVPALSFEDFVILVRADLAEDVAHLLTWCIVETRAAIERQYAHLQPRDRPLSTPLDPAKMCRTPVPLHPGAERYYHSAGLL